MSAEPRPGKVCLRCGERVQIHLYPKLGPGRYGDVCKACVRMTKKSPVLRVVRAPTPKNRICAGVCGLPKSIKAFRRVKPGEYSDTCRACENRLDDVQTMPSGRRLCLVCGPQPTARFAKDERGRWAECCVGCTGEPEVRVLVRHEAVAARVLKGLRQIASGRLDCSSGFPNLGADGLRQIAAELLAAVEDAR